MLRTEAEIKARLALCVEKYEQAKRERADRVANEQDESGWNTMLACYGSEGRALQWVLKYPDPYTINKDD
jgi:hypothetical protein